MIDRSPARVLFFLLLLSYGYFWGLRNANAQSRIDHIVSIVAHGTNAIDAYKNNTPDWSYYGGHTYSNKAPGISFLCVPAYFVLYHAERALGRNPLDPDSDLWWSNQMLLNVLFNGGTTALGALALLAILAQCGIARPTAYLAALAWGLATPAFPFTTSLYSHAMVASFLIFALYLLIVPDAAPRPWHLVLAGLFCGLATLSEYMAVGPTILLALYAWSERRSWRDAMLFCAGGLPMLAAFMAYHWACFGHPLTTAYAHQDPSGMRPGASGLAGWWQPPSLTRVAQLLFGPSRGLFFYCPLLLLSIPGLIALYRRGCRRLALVSGGIPMFLLAVASCWFLWTGGYSAGPRFFIPGIPFLMIGAAEAFARFPRTAIALGSVSFLNAFATASVQLTVPDTTFPSPLTQVVYPQLLRAQFEHDSLGQRLGLPGYASLLPLLALWGALGWRLCRMLRPPAHTEAVEPAPK